MTTADEIYSGNKASDYQPPTSNPQSNVAQDLQQNNSNLQPVSNQSSTNQQALPSVTDLKVTTLSTGSDSSTAPAALSHASTAGWVGWLVGGGILVIVVAVAYAVLKTSRSTTKPSQKSSLATETPKETSVKKSKKTPSKSKKKSPRKKKSTHKRKK